MWLGRANRQAFEKLPCGSKSVIRGRKQHPSLCKNMTKIVIWSYCIMPLFDFQEEKQDFGRKIRINFVMKKEKSSFVKTKEDFGQCGWWDSNPQVAEWTLDP